MAVIVVQTAPVMMPSLPLMIAAIAMVHISTRRKAMRASTCLNRVSEENGQKAGPGHFMLAASMPAPSAW